MFVSQRDIWENHQSLQHVTWQRKRWGLKSTWQVLPTTPEWKLFLKKKVLAPSDTTERQLRLFFSIRTRCHELWQAQHISLKCARSLEPFPFTCFVIFHHCFFIINFNIELHLKTSTQKNYTLPCIIIICCILKFSFQGPLTFLLMKTLQQVSSQSSVDIADTRER